MVSSNERRKCEFCGEDNPAGQIPCWKCGLWKGHKYPTVEQRPSKELCDLIGDLNAADPKDSPALCRDLMREAAYELEKLTAHEPPATRKPDKFDLAFEIMRQLEAEGMETMQSCQFGYVMRVTRERAPSPPSGDAEDAAKWRALRNCARITAMGSAGCQPGGESYPGPTAHVTLNFWTHNEPEKEAWHREWLDTFVAKARRVSETKSGSANG